MIIAAPKQKQMIRQIFLGGQGFGDEEKPPSSGRRLRRN